jgi:DNA ligase-1
MLSQPIYKRDANGRVRIWQYEVEGSCWRTRSGLQGGEPVTTGWTTCTPKSKPTAGEQALFEAQAEEKKKLDRDYRSTIEDVDRPRDSVVKPMLAHKFEGWVAGWRNIYAQPKLDGIRCIATANGLWSRQGKPIVSCRHIEQSLAPLFQRCPTLILDGELYNHELRDDFNTITSVVKKLKPSEEDSEKARSLIQYHVYDMPSHDGVFGERRDAIEDLELDMRDHLQKVHTAHYATEELLNAHYERCLDDGFEGQIVRLNGAYEQKRSKLLLKRKEFLDEEFDVIRVEEGQGNWAGYAKRAVLRLKDGREFGAGIRGTQDFCLKLLNGPAPASATVRYFALTPDGVPRFPVVTAFHEGARL